MENACKLFQSLTHHDWTKKPLILHFLFMKGIIEPIFRNSKFLAVTMFIGSFKILEISEFVRFWYSLIVLKIKFWYLFKYSFVRFLKLDFLSAKKIRLY